MQICSEFNNKGAGRKTGSYFSPQNLGDLGLGIGFKTQKVIYKVGMNGFWYPSFKKDPGLNLEFRLEYNL